MSSYINELWIFTRNGVPLVEVFNNSKIDPSLLGAFLSAMKSFGEEISGKTLTNFTFADSKFILTSALNGKIFLVAKTGTKVKEKKLRKVFEIISGFFEELYTEDEISNWKGDVSIFKRFRDKIELYFEMFEM